MAARLEKPGHAEHSAGPRQVTWSLTHQKQSPAGEVRRVKAGVHLCLEEKHMVEGGGSEQGTPR